MQGHHACLDGSHHVLDVMGDLTHPVADLGVALGLQELRMLDSRGCLGAEHLQDFQIMLREGHGRIHHLHDANRGATGALHGNRHHRLGMVARLFIHIGVKVIALAHIANQHRISGAKDRPRHPL